MKSRTEILVPLAAIQAVPIAVIAWYRLHRYAWYRYSAIVNKLMNPAKLLGTATESVGSKPFRAYMVDNSSAPAAGARMFSISVGGSTTAIEQLESTADSKAEYYDLQGRRLQNLQKGVNIVKRGGKTMKVIIK